MADDERALADLCASWLADDYEVRTAYDGREATERVDEAVDVALLDRRMPEKTGDEVVATIRDRGLDCQVAIVSAVEPDADLLDLPVDDYLTKPVTEAELHEVVAVLGRRTGRAEPLRRYFSLATRLEVVDRHLSVGDPQVDRIRADLETELAELSERVEETPVDWSEDELESVFRSLPPHLEPRLEA